VNFFGLTHYFLDYLISQLDQCLCSPLPRLNAELLLSANISKLDDTKWTTIKEEYIPMVPSPSRMGAELQSWKQAIEDNINPPTCDLAQALDDTIHLFSNIYTIFKILLTMPVFTATVERSFSTLRRLKTYLRNTMADDRLTALALLNIHKTQAISTEQVLRDFDSTGHRRIAIAFK
jgi:hypothetical protein